MPLTGSMPLRLHGWVQQHSLLLSQLLEALLPDIYITVLYIGIASWQELSALALHCNMAARGNQLPGSLCPLHAAVAGHGE